MTVNRALLPPPTGAAGRTAAVSSDATYAVDDLAAAWEPTRVDRIDLSPAAAALLRAGLTVRAAVLHGIESIRQRIPLRNGATLVLQFGIYFSV